MIHARKLKPDRSLGGLIPVLISLGIFGLSVLVFDFTISFYILAILMWLFSGVYLLIVLRTGNLAYLVSVSYLVYAGVMLYLAPYYINRAGDDMGYRLAWFTGIIFFDILMAYVIFTKRIKWRGREIFELAGADIDDTNHGYTSRPRPIGKVEISKTEIQSFARYLSRHLIALTYTTANQVFFVPVKMGHEFKHLLRVNSPNTLDTWISFAFDGDVSVHVGHKDYLDYWEPLAFDQLCESLGQLFVEFAELHRQGEGVRIIDRMDAVGLGYFS